MIFFFDEWSVIQSPREFGEIFDDEDPFSTKRSTAKRRKRRKKRRSIHRREADKTKRHEPREMGANAKTAG